jgi:hypothetical protein
MALGESDAPIPVTLLTLVTLQSPYRSGHKVSAVSAVSALLIGPRKAAEMAEIALPYTTPKLAATTITHRDSSFGSHRALAAIRSNVSGDSSRCIDDLSPFAWRPCCLRTIQRPLAASPCGRLSRPRSTISQSDCHRVIGRWLSRAPSTCERVRLPSSHWLSSVLILSVGLLGRLAETAMDLPGS